jgi:catechol 2,3-dioxygenase-like lactoylglutathione lyase family enzyme
METRWILILVPAIFLAGARGVDAQQAAITGLAHVALRVTDVDREVNFLGKLGYEEAFASVDGTKVMEVFVKVNDRQFIEVYPRTNPSEPLGWMHACYESDDDNGLEALYASHGLNPSKVAKGAAGNLIFSVKDAEGRVTEFTQYLPGSRHFLDKGQHLGEDRISDTLLGFDLPVADMTTAGQFYSKLGFDVEDAGAALHLTAPGAPGLRIVLHAAGPNSTPQLLFTIRDARKTEDQLRHLGVKVNRQKKLVFVSDPDGNSFVLLETGAEQGLARASSSIN